MATTAVIAREARRAEEVKRGMKKREKLKLIISSLDVDFDEKMAAVMSLNKRKRDESPVRKQRRCQRCGRPHAVYRKFGLCRICLRNAAMFGYVPGLVKASW